MYVLYKLRTICIYNIHSMRTIHTLGHVMMSDDGDVII